MVYKMIVKCYDDLHGTRSTALFSECENYRYNLLRRWSDGPRVMFLLLNPSTADERVNDPTVKRCITYAKKWGFGSIYIANLFAYRSTVRSVLKKIPDPIGPFNNDSILAMTDDCDLIVTAWSNDGILLNRSSDVLKLLLSKRHREKLSYLVMNKTDQPSHALYLKGCLDPKRWTDEQIKKVIKGDYDN